MDETTAIRQQMCQTINTASSERDVLETQYGRVWDTSELRSDFEVLGFSAPVVVVRRKSDGQKGSLMFQHRPRYYWSFDPA